MTSGVSEAQAKVRREHQDTAELRLARARLDAEASAARETADADTLASSLSMTQIAPGTTNLNPQDPPLYETIRSQFRGFLCVALANIPKGTRILSEKPLFSVPKPHRAADIGYEFYKLPAAKQQAFMSLHCLFLDHATPFQIFDFNNIETGNRRSVCLDVSRFNHSCLPNAYMTWNTAIRRVTIHAVKDIPRHEEIIIDYNIEDHIHDSQQRRKYLTGYGFICNCPACDLWTPFGQASDVRRHQMRRLENRITNSSINNNNNHSNDSETSDLQRFDHKPLLEPLELITLLQEEGLVYPGLADNYERVAEWYMARFHETKEGHKVNSGILASDFLASARQEALLYARKKLDLDLLCNGADSSIVRCTLRWIREDVFGV